MDELHAEPNEEEKEQVDHDVLSGSVEQGISEIAPHLCMSSPDDCFRGQYCKTVKHQLTCQTEEQTEIGDFSGFLDSTQRCEFP